LHRFRGNQNTRDTIRRHPRKGELLEEVGVFARDALIEGLELEPAGERRAHERVGVLGGFVRDSAGLASGFGEQLRLAGAVHGNEPPGGFVDAVADGEQAVIAEDGGFFRSERAGDAVTFGSFLDDAAVIFKDHVILVKRASILRERIEQAAERGPGLAVQRMGVRGCDHVRAGGVNARVNGEGGEIDFRAASTTLPE